MRRLATLLCTLFSLASPGCGARHEPATLPAAPSPRAPADGSALTARASSTREGERPPRPGEDDGSGETPRATIDLETIRIEVVGRDPGGEPALEAFDARSLLDDGNAAMAEERYDDAIAAYEKLLATFPDSRLASSAIYNIGLAHEAKGEHDAAIDRYRGLAGSPALDRDSVEAHMRIGAVLAELERWAEAQRALREVLGRKDLTHADRIEAMARLGYVTLEQKDYATAESVLREATAYYDELTTGLDDHYFIAMSRYYLAQIPHRQFQAIPMRLPDEQLRRDLDLKAELVKLAYDRYREVLALRHVYWATAAGYQMSQIYKEFWDHIVLAPVPAQLDRQAAAYYVEEVHQRVLTFLEKALSGHQKNVELADAYRTSTVWSDASRARADEIAKILARETSGELVTPERSVAGAAPDAAAGSREYIPARIEL